MKITAAIIALTTLSATEAIRVFAGMTFYDASGKFIDIRPSRFTTHDGHKSFTRVTTKCNESPALDFCAGIPNAATYVMYSAMREPCMPAPPGLSFKCSDKDLGMDGDR
jgi:hypothetical protein